MNFLTILHRWEKKLVHTSRGKLIRVVSLFFIGSVVIGFIISWQRQLVIQQKVEKTKQELKEQEYTRMQERIETMKEARYVRG